MNKKILTAAVGAALVASAGLAQADVKIYGKVQADVVGVTNSANNKTTQIDDVGQSRLGFDAVEDLGGGLKGLARIEFGTNPVETISPNSGASTNYAFSSRLHWVGLQGGFGTFALGTFDSPYKQAGGVNWDPFVATSFEARSNGGMSGSGFGHTSYLQNGFMYTTPKFAGVTGQLFMSPDDSNQTANNGTSGTTIVSAGQGNKDYSASLQWTGGPLTVIAAKSKDANGFKSAINADSSYDNKAATLTKFGVQGKFGNHTVSVQRELDKHGLNAASTGGLSTNGAAMTATDPGVLNGKVTFLGYQMKLGNEVIVVQVGEHNYLSQAEGVDSHYRALGVIHNFSKNTRAYLGYRLTTNDAGLLTSTNAVSTTPNTAKIKVVGGGLNVNF